MPPTHSPAIEPSDRYHAVKVSFDERDQLAHHYNHIFAGVVALETIAVIVLGFWCGRLANGVKTVPLVIIADPVSGSTHRVTGGAEIHSGDPLWGKVRDAWFTEFVTEWRGVTMDDQYRRMLWDHSHTFIGRNSPAHKYLSAWYRDNNPDFRAMKETVTVRIESSGPVTPETYEVWWTETSYPKPGAQAKPPQRWRGLFTHASDDKTLTFYISQISTTAVKE